MNTLKNASLFIAGLTLGLCLWAAAPVLAPAPAHAQAIDHNAIRSVLTSMKLDINQMIQLVNQHQAATVAVGDEQITLTSGQLTQIITRYNSLKAGLAAKYQQLP